MRSVLEVPLADGRTARVAVTDRTDGDLAVGGDPAVLADRRRAVVDLPWTWLRQVHGDRVVVVDTPGGGAGEEADAAVTAVTGAALAVHTADCGPLALVADRGAVAVAHAGWKGLAAGVVERSVDVLRSVADGPVRAVVGTHIGVECYEFGADELAGLVARLGPRVEGRTADGTPALDLREGLRAALARAGVEDVLEVGGCTACDPAGYSHRARGDLGRQAVLAWIEAT